MSGRGVQHTWMAELAGPRAAGTAVGLGLAVSSAGVTIGPLVFGYVVQTAGGYRGPWITLALAMVGAIGTLFLVRDRRRPALGGQTTPGPRGRANKKCCGTYDPMLC